MVPPGSARGLPSSGGPLRWLASASFGVLQAIAFSVALDDVAAMCEPVEGGSGEAFAAEHFGPVLEGQVGGDEKALALISPADHLE